jgi:glutathione S-transferase
MFNPISTVPPRSSAVRATKRRVWITLLEKQIPFEPIIVNLDGEKFQFQSEFTVTARELSPN